MTIDQTLKYLCPAEWQDAAYSRNFAIHAIVAVRTGKMILAKRFFLTTVARMGLLRWLRATGPALIDSLITTFSRHLSHKIKIAHEPAVIKMNYLHE